MKAMAKKTVKKKKGRRNSEELSGMHIYKDDHNRYVYYDVFSHTGYVINNVQSYRTYNNRFLLAIVAGVLLYTFDFGAWKLPIALGVALVIYAVMEFKFRSYLKQQTILMNFQRKERPARILTAASESPKRILIKIVLLALLSILIIILPFDPLNNQKYDIVSKIVCIIVGIGAAYLCIFHIYALIYKSKNNIEDRY